MQVSFVFLIASKVREKALTLEGKLNEIMLLEWRGFHGPHISICSMSLSIIPELLGLSATNDVSIESF